MGDGVWQVVGVVVGGRRCGGLMDEDGMAVDYGVMSVVVDVIFGDVAVDDVADDVVAMYKVVFAVS